MIKVDKRGAVLIENIKTTMAVDNYHLKDKEINTLLECYGNEMKVNEAIENIKKEYMGKKY
ncbi:MAG: hypothetical protein MJ246_02345 [Clostridia bacterium]|nr:hypothetical protein [Clostridia bacterium]